MHVAGKVNVLNDDAIDDPSRSMAMSQRSTREDQVDSEYDV